MGAGTVDGFGTGAPPPEDGIGMGGAVLEGVGTGAGTVDGVGTGGATAGFPPGGVVAPGNTRTGGRGGIGGLYWAAGTTCMTNPTGRCVGPNGPGTLFFTGDRVLR